MALLKKDIERVQAQTVSHAAACRLLHVSFTTYKIYAKMYGLYDTAQKNKAGKGTRKPKRIGIFGLQEIFDGKHPNYNRSILRDRLIAVNLLPAGCNICGTQQTRPDGRGPFLLDNMDGNRTNYALSNLQIICYNCYFLTNGHIAYMDKHMSAPATPPANRDYVDELGTDELEALRTEFLEGQS